MDNKIEHLIDLAFKLLPSSAVGAIVNTLMFLQKNSGKKASSVLFVQFGLSMFIGISVGYMAILFLKENDKASGWALGAAIVGYKGMELLIDAVLATIKKKTDSYGDN